MHFLWRPSKSPRADLLISVMVHRNSQRAASLILTLTPICHSKYRVAQHFIINGTQGCSDCYLNSYDLEEVF